MTEPSPAPEHESDVCVLSRNPALRHLREDDLRSLCDHLVQRVYPPGSEIVHEGDPGEHMYFILEGHVRLSRGHLELRSLGPSEHFGELALLGVHQRAATAEALDTLRVAQLSRDDYLRLAELHPGLVVRLLQSLLDTVGVELVAMTDSVDRLLGERLLPRRTQVHVIIDGSARDLPTGTRIGELLPSEVAGAPVVAALLDSRPVSLDTPVVSDAALTPLTGESWEGREVLRRSAGLLLLEALAEELPGASVALGPPLEAAQYVELSAPVPASELVDLAKRLTHAMRHKISQHVRFRQELWTLEEARAELSSRGWSDAASLLDTWREATVPLSSCGRVYALTTGPMAPHAGLLEGTSVVTRGGSLFLVFGEGARRKASDPDAELEIEAQAPRFGGEMVEEQRRWASVLEATSVGTFNQLCVTGRVSELIRVAEGFHEKRIGRLADAVAARRSSLRVITIAGPSSSGKTTFIKRLTTQLVVNGLQPIAISLDDYYVDRERTPRDVNGEYDFEALEALDLAQLQADVRSLLAGVRVRPPRYDFKLGKSLRQGGHELVLGPSDVLLLEGIHGLNPALLGDAVSSAQLFRVFIHPAFTLPLDRVNPVSPADLRLIRRIVRDRHQRGTNAADNIARWPSVRRGELAHIYPFVPHADAIFDSALIYEPSVLKVFADRYLLEVPSRHPSHTTAHRLRRLLDRFVTIYPDHVPPTSILREFIGGSGFEY